MSSPSYKRRDVDSTRGFERVGVDDDVRLFVVDVDGDDIEAARTIVKVVAREVVERHLRDTALFPRCHGGGAAAEFVAGPRFDFNEDGDLAIPGHDVDFAESRPVSPGKNHVPAAPELVAGELFARFS